MLPETAGPTAVRELLELLTRSAARRFSVSSRTAEKKGKGCCRFRMRGVSIALDLPIRDNTQSIVDSLNEFVVVGGRANLSGEGCVYPGRSFPRDGTASRRVVGRFAGRGIRTASIRSAQSVRLFGDPAVNVVVFGGTRGIGRAVARRTGRARRPRVPARPLAGGPRQERARPRDSCRGTACRLASPSAIWPGPRRSVRRSMPRWQPSARSTPSS